MAGAVTHGAGTSRDEWSVGGFVGAAGVGAASGVVFGAAGQGLSRLAKPVLSKAGGRLGGALSKVGKGCGRNSFTGSTPVVLGDGVSSKAMKVVRLGDRVFAADPVSGVRGPRRVVGLIRHAGAHAMVAVTLAVGGVTGAATAAAAGPSASTDAVAATEETRGAVPTSVVGKTSTAAGAQELAASAVPATMKVASAVTVEKVPAALTARTTLHATADHPFYQPDTKTWVPAKNLTVGTHALDLAGKPVEVLDTKPYRQTLTAYNLTVESLHTYHVGDGVLVHNTEGCGTGDIRFGPNRQGPLPSQHANSFRSGSYTQATLGEDTTLYRVHSADQNMLGSYWTRTKPEGPMQAQLDLALNPSWGNDASGIATIRAPAGTTVFDGFAAPQPIGDGRVLPGGGSQVFITQVDPSWLVK